MSTDRTQYKQVVAGSLGDNRTIANAINCVQQDAQRFQKVDVGGAALTATTTYNFPVARVERPVLVKEVRILPGGALTTAAGNYTTISYGYTNDNTGIANITTLGQINTANTAANGGTGNWASGTSILVTAFTSATVNTNANQSINSTIPAGSQIFVISTPTGGAGVAVPAGTAFQMLWEEV